MTRKHFDSLAWELRQSHAHFAATLPLEGDTRWAAERAWDLAVLSVAAACRASNPRFDQARFLVAAGYTHRPDGSQYPVQWTPAGRLAVRS